ncbi:MULTISPECIES: DUF6232 family protein [Streptomyces]|uniref:DUF6232 family protein n=1 Tax=Streptomyces TaxID=1883 RepID=UPI000AFD9DD2|nr:MULTISPECIES: DUF6232 family protein [Streptomyces]
MEANGTPPPKPTHTPTPRPAHAPPPSAPPPRHGLVISKRLLWVHGGAYPLENIVRVYTFVLRPRRGEAFARFLKRGGLTLVLFLILMQFEDSSSSSWDSYGSSGGDDGVLAIALFILGTLLLYFFGAMCAVVFAMSHDVLAIETNGRSTALVTGKRAYLDGLVRSIAEAIDKPDAEFQASVGTLAITNYGDYYFGDSVNMYGGSGNTGVAK